MVHSTKIGMKIFCAGEPVPYCGEYVVVDDQGNKQGCIIVTLDKGETFPEADSLLHFQDTCIKENPASLGSVVFKSKIIKRR
jgi:hypothetical protein